MKKIISLVAVVAMMFTLCSVGVSAVISHEFPEGETAFYVEYTANSDTVAPGGKIIITVTDYIYLREGTTSITTIANNGWMDFDETLEVTVEDMVQIKQFACETRHLYEVVNDGEYSELNTTTGYGQNLADYNVGGVTELSSMTIEFDVPADAPIGTKYNFNYYYGGFAVATNLDVFVYDVEANPTEVLTVTVAEAAVEEPAVAPTAAAQEVRQGCKACGVAAGVRFISSIDTAAAGDGLEGYGIEITYNGVTKDVPAVNTFKTEGNVVYFTAVITNAPAGATFVAQPYAKYADGKVYATAGANA